MEKPNENHLHLSWYDSAWIPILNQSNVLDYFSERSNPFYDRTCNNEIIKMQRLNVEHLSNMTGLEYILLHVQEPILYVIRKQHRHSPTQVSPLGVYYIIAGIVYQAPDLASVVNSRLLNTVHNLQSSFEEAQAFSRYHPSKGYWWEFKDREVKDKPETKEKRKREEPSSLFQRQRVDMLLEELGKKYPPQFVAPHHDNREEAVAGGATKTEVKQEVKVEKVEEKASPAPQSAPPTPTGGATPASGSAAAMKPPPEKKAKVR